jgi:amidophosphoribosyltransferase
MEKTQPWSDSCWFTSIRIDNPGERDILAGRVMRNQFKMFSLKSTNALMVLTIQNTGDVANAKKQATMLAIVLGHVRYGTLVKNSIESYVFLHRGNNWMHRNLIVAGSFND